MQSEGSLIYKIYLSSNMSQQCLNHLMLLNVHKNHTDNLKLVHTVHVYIVIVGNVCGKHFFGAELNSQIWINRQILHVTFLLIIYIYLNLFSLLLFKNALWNSFAYAMFGCPTFETLPMTLLLYSCACSLHETVM